jgi:molybdopterin converting factor small subunit
MIKKIKVTPAMQHMTGNREFVEVEGNTVRECIDDLIKKFPGFKDWFDVNAPVAWVVVNEDRWNLKDMDRILTEKDELGLVLVVGGG